LGMISVSTKRLTWRRSISCSSENSIIDMYPLNLK
jgi:hypothetical protein